MVFPSFFIKRCKSFWSVEDCYVIHQNKAVVLKAEVYYSANKETIRELISDVIIKLRT